MRPRETLALILPLVLSLLLAGFLAGCGGDEGSGNQSGGGQGQGAKAGGAKQKRLSGKIAIGTVRAYKDDKRRLSLRPAAKAQGEKPIGFKVRKRAQVTLDGKEAELGDIVSGQQAQIRYVVQNDINRATIVQLFSRQPSAKDKKQPSNEDKQSSGGVEKTG